MRAAMTFDNGSLEQFKRNVSVAINKVGRGTKKATKAAAEDILKLSLGLVPRETSTLASSASYSIGGHWRVGFTAVIGYGIDKDPINPKTGRPVSEYATVVHEDLYAHHDVGQAKFLEAAVVEYAKENFPRTVMRYTAEAFDEIRGG